MIIKVLVIKNGGVEVSYKNGIHRGYSLNKMPQSALNFILENDTIGHDTEWCTYYTK